MLSDSLRVLSPGALRWFLSSTTVALLALTGIGCRAQPTEAPTPENSRLRHIEVPAGSAPADADRAALARLVGVWTFEGWSIEAGKDRKNSSGRAAAAIENEHFVLIDFQAASGQLAGHAGRKSGSMLFASEPGQGITLTAWGDASPSISRFVGKARGSGSKFSFKEVKTPPGRSRLSVVIIFETDDRWTLKVHDASAVGEPLIASYLLTRATR